MVVFLGQERIYMNGGKVFVDTNIVVYAYDADAKEKHNISSNILKELWHSGLGVISTQVLQEFFVIITKKIASPLDLKTAKEIIGDLSMWDVVVNNVEVILQAIEIHQQYRYLFWDSLIIAAAIRSGAGILLSEDFSDGQVIDGVKLKNPFKT